MSDELEIIACQPQPVNSNGFNSNAELPYGCQVEHIHQAMNEFINAKFHRDF
jgi:hypothetical protein